MSCDRRRAQFIEQVLTAAPAGAAAPAAAALEKTFQDACLPPRSAAERITNEAKVRALFQTFGKAGVERPTHDQSGLPATDALCAGYARLYDELTRRRLLAPITARSSSGAQLPPRQEAAAPAPVRVTSPDQREQNEHLQALRLAHTRRLRVMELQLAKLGDAHAPAHLILDIEDTATMIRELDEQSGALHRAPRALEARGALVSVEQQRAILQSIADIVGVPAGKIRLIDIILGSIILTIQLPLAAAARFMALSQARHPRLVQMNLTGVELLAARGRDQQPVEAALLRAVEHERALLLAALPADDDPTFQRLIQALQASASARPDALQNQIADHLAQRRQASDAMQASALPAGMATLRLTLAMPAEPADSAA